MSIRLMKRLVAALVAVAASAVIAPPSAAAPTVENTGLGEAVLFDLWVPSASLGHVSVLVKLPAPASQAPAGGWPVVFLLHGTTEVNTERWGWQARFPKLYDLAARDNVVLVMPEGGRAGYYSDWRSGARWETFHLGELPKYLKTNGFPINFDRKALAGFSMGGFGALSYAARHPGRFAAVVALSPVADPLRNPSIVLNDLRDAGLARYNLWGNPKTSTGKALWKKHDPYYLAKGLKGTYLYLYAGKNGDGLETTLRAQTIRLIKKIKKLGTKKLKITLSTHTGSTGSHAYAFWEPRLYAAWPGVVAALKKS